MQLAINPPVSFWGIYLREIKKQSLLKDQYKIAKGVYF